MKKNLTVKDLAKELGMELDDVLVTLWDGGLTTIEKQDDFIPKKRTNQARRILGAATKKDLMSISYWRSLFQLDEKEFIDFALSLGIRININQKRIPTGKLKRLKHEARKKGLIKKKIEPKISNKNLDRKFLGDFNLPTIGQRIEPVHLNEDEILSIHNLLVKDFENAQDPISPPGIRDIGLLSSAVNRPKTSFGNQLKYNTIELSTGALTHSLILNHPFLNGNKRTALVSMLSMMDKNGLVFTCNEDNIFRFILTVAQHKLIPDESSFYSDREVTEIAKWIFNNSRKIEKGDRTISWRRLDKILRQYKCKLIPASGVGNRLNISRKILEKGLFFTKKRILTTQVYFAGMGRDADFTVIKKIRKDLKLQSEDGVDSNFFYQLEPHSIDDFINRYRKTLKRLSKL